MLQLIAAFVAVAAAAGGDGQYRPERYQSANSDGRYVHVPNPYLHAGSDGGQYRHQGDKQVPYVHRVEASPAYQAPVVPRYQPIPVVAQPPAGWAILRQVQDIQPQGDYAYEFETENKIHAAEQSRVQSVGPQSILEKKTGFYEYTGDDGVRYRVDYVADENGFQPTVSYFVFVCFLHCVRN